MHFYCYNPEVDYFSITRHSKVFYSSYTVGKYFFFICLELHLSMWNIQETFWKHPGNIQETSRKHPVIAYNIAG